MIRIIIAGSRNFDDYKFIKEKLLKELNLNIKLEIVHGNARGVDKLGEKFAKEFNIPYKRFKADWEKYGKKAGGVRNTEMAKYSDALIAFWNGYSIGTKDMIKKAKQLKLPYKVFFINQE